MMARSTTGWDDLIPRGAGLNANDQEYIGSVLDDRRAGGCHLEGDAGLAGSPGEAPFGEDSPRGAG
jgi:hypothetical protein